MSGKTILITGGAGFVGSHCADALVRRGHRVRIFDNLCEQVHASRFPAYLAKEVEFIYGDVRDRERVNPAVRGADVIFHLAAAVGVGQSMYRVSDYIAANTLGTANLLQAILDTRSQPEKIVLASSMSIYGEGKYLCAECGEVAPPARLSSQLQAKQWETICPHCERVVAPVPTDEGKPLQCTSIYALSKKDQEEMTLLFGSAPRVLPRLLATTKQGAPGRCIGLSASWVVHLCLFPLHHRPGSQVPYESPDKSHASYTPDPRMASK